MIKSAKRESQATEWRSSRACPAGTVSYASRAGITCARTCSSPVSIRTTARCRDTKSIRQGGCTSTSVFFLRLSSEKKSLGSPVFYPRLNKLSPRLPDKVSFAEGALLEPLSVVLQGIRTAGLGLGQGAVICGAGPIGLIALAAARASGAHPLVITDLEPRRLEFARSFVPTCTTYQVDRALDAEGNARAIRALFGGEEYFCPRTILECTGVESSICTAAFTVRRGGRVMVIGVGRPVMNNLPFMHMSLAEIDVKFINRYRDTWPSGIACLAGGILDLKHLVSHTFPLEHALEALELCSDLSKGSIKVQIVDEVDAGF